MIDTVKRARRPHVRRNIDRFRVDVLRGLRAREKNLPCKYFYDERGSNLFEKITELDEYYPTRTERAIMRQHAAEMGEVIGPQCLLVEYGSGSSSKTRMLLNELKNPAGYVPIDVSKEFLLQSASELAAEYPHLQVAPLCADFSRSFELPPIATSAARRIVYFPGSTLGNFVPESAISLLRRTAELCGSGGGLLLGADLRKDSAVIEAAYNDRQGVTAAFNRNILVRINRELDANFDIERFAHHAYFNQAEGRIEMHLVSRGAQIARIGGEELRFAPGESIRTEYSYKFDWQTLQSLASESGFEIERMWTDANRYFGVYYLSIPSSE